MQNSLQVSNSTPINIEGQVQQSHFNKNLFLGHTWQCSGLMLGRLGGPFGVLGIEPRSATCKADLTLLWPLIKNF